MKTPRVAEQRRLPARDLRLSLVRGAMALPWRCEPPGGDLDSDEILRAARAASAQTGAFLIGGGDPLQRNDVWSLLGELSQVRSQGLGICTLGPGVSDALVQRLRSVGVQRVHVAFHSARQDAHDWLVGQPGALKAAHRAIRACLEADVPVVADVVLTRPTMLHVAETVEVLARIGVRKVCVRRLTAMDAEGAAFVPLSPRLFLLEEGLEQAAAAALRQGVRLILQDLPTCVAPRLRPLFAAPDREGWVMPDGSVKMRIESWRGCPSCPGSPRCAGVPQDYASRFGWEEFTNWQSDALRVHESVDDQKAEPRSSPMSFTWRAPHRVDCVACADVADELASSQQPFESTRVIRARLVQAARYRPSVLRLVGADLLGHPQAALLIFDALRLFRRVEVAGEAGSVAEWSELELRRLKGLRHLDFALYGPDAASHDEHCGVPGAFAAMQRGVELLRAKTEIPVGGYAIVHDARVIPAFAAAWEQGLLPGEPRFRLSAQGGPLDDLLQCARALQPGPARSALLALLPRCTREQEGLGATNDEETAVPNLRGSEEWLHWGCSQPYQACGSDPIGAFESCSEAGITCTSPMCPGTPVGWQRAARSGQWTASL